jgi:hypothetical protein
MGGIIATKRRKKSRKKKKSRRQKGRCFINCRLLPNPKKLHRTARRFATFVLFRATNSNRLKIFFLIFKKYDLSIPFFEICSV